MIKMQLFLTTFCRAPCLYWKSSSNSNECIPTNTFSYSITKLVGLIVLFAIPFKKMIYALTPRGRFKFSYEKILSKWSAPLMSNFVHHMKPVMILNIKILCHLIPCVLKFQFWITIFLALVEQVHELWVRVEVS